jgi:hypothetical protein
MGLGHCNRPGTKAKSIVILIPSLEQENDKQCLCCGQFKPINEFYANNLTKIQNICKLCDHTRRNKNRRKIFERTGIWPGTQKD